MSLFFKKVRFFAADTQLLPPGPDNPGMTMPRPIHKNTSYLLTRRCTQRQFLLVPRVVTTQIFTYVLALAAEKTGVLVHAVAVLSNHWHTTLSDPEGRMPEFMAYVHKYVAKAVNVSLDRCENLWATEQPSLVRLEDDDSMWEKMIYTLLNPVAAGLVRDPSQWPGLWGYRGEITVTRPEVYFREDGNMPEKATLRFTPPPVADAYASVEAFYTAFEADLERRRRALVAEMAAEGRGFMGPEAVLRQDVYDRPRTEEAEEGTGHPASRTVHPGDGGILRNTLRSLSHDRSSLRHRVVRPAGPVSRPARCPAAGKSEPGG